MTLTPNCPGVHFLDDVENDEMFSHPSCTFYSVIYFLNILDVVTIIVKKIKLQYVLVWNYKSCMRL